MNSFRFAKYLKVGVSVVLIGYLIKKVGLINVISIITSATIGYIILSLIFFSFCFLLHTYRWRRVLSIQNVSINFMKLLTFNFVGIFFNNFFPSTIGGDVIRIYDVSRYINSVLTSFNAILIERFLSLLALALIANIALMLNSEIVFDMGITITVISFFMVISIIQLGILSDRAHQIFKELLNVFRLNFLRKKIEDVTVSLSKFRKNKFELINILGLSFVHQGLGIIYVYIVGLALHINVSILYFFVTIPIVCIVTMLPISFNGIGIREGAYVYLFSKIGITPAEAISLSLLSHILTVVFSLVGGVIYALRKT